MASHIAMVRWFNVVLRPEKQGRGRNGDRRNRKLRIRCDHHFGGRPAVSNEGLTILGKPAGDKICFFMKFQQQTKIFFVVVKLHNWPQLLKL